MTVLMIDFHNACHRAAHGNKKLWSPDGETFTGMIHGFFSSLTKYINEFKPDHIWIMSDPNVAAEKSNWRSMYAPEYKQRSSKRDEAAEKQYRAVQAQIPMLKEACKALNVFWFEQAHLEADEIIGSMVCSMPQQNFVLVSTDKDFFPLLRPGFCIFYPGKKRSMIVGHENFPALSADFIPDQGKKPEAKKIRVNSIAEWAEFRYLTGDSSDLLPGLHKCGKAKADHILKAGGYDAFCEQIKADQLAGKKVGKIDEQLVTKEARAVYVLNRYLMAINPPPAKHVNFDMTNERCFVGSGNFNWIKDWLQGFGFADTDHSVLRKLQYNDLCKRWPYPYQSLRNMYVG